MRALCVFGDRSIFAAVIIYQIEYNDQQVSQPAKLPANFVENFGFAHMRTVFLVMISPVAWHPRVCHHIIALPQHRRIWSTYT
jgi:hypothetical protein